jgi:N-acetylneuraminic acid mutarotase
MSLLLKRSTLLVGALLLAATPMFADSPSARVQGKLIYDPVTTYSILFGGATDLDAGTRLSYDLDETWEWVGNQWVQLRPAHRPPGRSLLSAAYDTTRSRIVIFGGKSGTPSATTVSFTDLQDTWFWKDGDWTKIETATAPSNRVLASMAYDPSRDRIVLFGGLHTTIDSKGIVATNTFTDTWEFDGTNWTQKQATGPTVNKPELAWDALRSRIVMLGTDNDNKVVMYGYDPAKAEWSNLAPAKLPACLNEGGLVYQTHNDTLLYTGGVCTDSSVIDSTWQWDGTTWAELTVVTPIDRFSGMALTYDQARKEAVMFSGTLAFSIPRSDTHVFKNGDWSIPEMKGSPLPRSLTAFQTDPVNKLIWMFGGQNDYRSTLEEFWKFKDEGWEGKTRDNGPSFCGYPASAFDTDRNVLVVVCSDSSIFEWDGNAWKNFPTLKTTPPSRNFSKAVYDPTLKKTILYGGHDGTDYISQLWTWDGTAWTQVKKHNGPIRALMNLWYDPIMKKTVLYGGIGRKSAQDRVERYADMWSFDGSKWTDMKATGTPPARYGAQAAVDLRNNHLYLFGGLRLDVNGAVQSQVYADDMWEWNGASWAQLTPPSVPPARENGAMAYDPSREQLVLFGGWNGHYLSDLWKYKDGKWTLWDEVIEDPAPPADPSAPATAPARRRTSSH